MAIHLNRAAHRLVALAGLTALLLLAGCGGIGGAEATPIPTRTPLPTFTPTVEGGQPAAPVEPAAPAAEQPAVDTPAADAAVQTPAADAQATDAQAPDAQATVDPDQVVVNTPAPAQTPTAAVSPTAAAAQVTTNDIVNIRSGPGTSYGLVGSAQVGESFRATGKNAAGDWWQIDYKGQPGWIFAQLVTASGTEGVAVAQNIPAAPTAAPVPPTNTPAPVVEAPPAEQPPAEQPPAEQQPDPNNEGNFPYILGGSVNCQPNPGITYFKGFTRDANNNPINAVCVHMAFFGPRTTKCSGCDGVGDGNWGFAPFGSSPAPRGTAVEIFVVECPSNLPKGGQNDGFGELVPQSPKWTRTINDSEQCEGITFYKK